MLFDELYSLLPLEIRERLENTQQSPIYHAENYVINHLKLIYKLLPQDNINFCIITLFHDMAKIEVTRCIEKDNKLKITSIGHENFCKKYIDKYQNLYYDYSIDWDCVREVCYYHMRMHDYISNRIKKPHKREFMENLKYFEELKTFSLADAEGRMLENGYPFLLILVGPPGSGKSTWVKDFVSRTNYKVVCPDEIRKELTGSISDQSQNATVFETAYHRLKENLNNKENTIFDSCACNMRTIKSLKTIAKDKAIVVFKIFNVDAETCKNRIKEDIKNGVDRSNVPDEVIDRMRGVLDEILPTLLQNEMILKE